MSDPITAHLPDEGQSPDWSSLEAALPWLAAMRDAPHDPVHHAEGCVLTHTRLVTEELIAAAPWRSAGARDRRVLFAAALLHDVAKPSTAQVDANGRVSHPGHSRQGASRARRILWEAGWTAAERERVCALVAAHQVPFWLLERSELDARLFLARESLRGASDGLGFIASLAALADADARGRVAPDRARMIDNVALFADLAHEEGCRDAPFDFPDAETRFAAYRPGASIDPRWTLGRPARRPEMVILSGLPGSGKSTWIARHRPEHAVVSLDALREAMDIDAEDNQGAVVQAAKEAAREHLRAGRSFVWDATNLSRSLRGGLVTLGDDYGFRITVVALDADPATLRNRMRERGRVVPWPVVLGMIGKWDYPDPVEAHTVLTDAWRVGGDT